MKLNPFTRGDTPSLLQKEIDASAAAVAKLVDLQNARANVLIETDDITVIEKHDSAIAALQRQIDIHTDRVAALQARALAERAAAHTRNYEASVDSIARLLPLRADAAAEVQASIIALASSVKKYVEISGSIVNQWPTNISRPAYQLGVARLAECLRSAFSHPALIFASTRQPLAAADLVQRACSAEEREQVAGFAAGEAAGHEALLGDLRGRGGVPDRPPVVPGDATVPDDTVVALRNNGEKEPAAP
jgi:hypothetical protein